MRFADNADAVSDSLNAAREGQDALNAALGHFYETAAPSAAKDARDLAEANVTLANSALMAAEAELAKRKIYSTAVTQPGTGMSPEDMMEYQAALSAHEAAAIRDVMEAEKILADARSAMADTVRLTTGGFAGDVKKTVEATTSLTVTIDGVTGALGGMRAAGREAEEGLGDAADEVVHGWDAVAASLDAYAEKARSIGGDIGNALVGAFQSAENAIGDFVKNGKMNFSDLVTSMLADMAKLGARRFLLGPLAGVLGHIPDGSAARGGRPALPPRADGGMDRARDRQLFLAAVDAGT